ncbi:MAG: hypothetical protein QF926_04870 [Alphaproteobacteria bacterium]|jgi:hypothetical protein|nr:hypothetical protein [Alphaproteobacteria bacterium]MDP6515942.1 hypothetical protein [Alphaproteobacteria bacterium]|tara:strand:- start:737 stop:1039 length:303 start_codon:yes stop_codon:yes gene_type:complete
MLGRFGHPFKIRVDSLVEAVANFRKRIAFHGDIEIQANRPPSAIMTFRHAPNRPMVDLAKYLSILVHVVCCMFANLAPCQASGYRCPNWLKDILGQFGHQ